MGLTLCLLFTLCAINQKVISRKKKKKDKKLQRKLWKEQYIHRVERRGWPWMMIYPIIYYISK